MTTFSTASTYITNINETFPVAGQDNNTQGFRDNFKNTKTSLELLDEDVNSLKINSVVLTNPINNFSNNIIKQAVFQDCGTVVFDTTTETYTGNLTLDYRNGSFQKYKLSSGTHWISITNWPGTNKSGSMILSVTTSSNTSTYVNFSGVTIYNLGPDDFPIDINGRENTVFHIWSDSDTDSYYIKQINQDYKFTKPAVLASYSTSTLSTLGTTTNGSIVFVQDYSRPAYHSNGIWYLMTGTALTL